MLSQEVTQIQTGQALNLGGSGLESDLELRLGITWVKSDPALSSGGLRRAKSDLALSLGSHLGSQ